jgi:hypothetical protein
MASTLAADGRDGGARRRPDGCTVPPPRSDYRSWRQPDDLGWVCAQQWGTKDLPGQITFNDVQRSLCYVGTLNNRPPNFAALEVGAVSETRRCDGGRAFELLRASPPARTIRGLYERLNWAATLEGEPLSCMAEAMLQGMVAALGPGYRFRSINAPLPDAPDATPSTEVLAENVAYVRFPRYLTGGRTIIENALRSAREDHAIGGLMLDIRGADGGPVDDLVARSKDRAGLLEAAHQLAAAGAGGSGSF